MSKLYKKLRAECFSDAHEQLGIFYRYYGTDNIKFVEFKPGKKTNREEVWYVKIFLKKPMEV